jgi:hypothetical protein
MPKSSLAELSKRETGLGALDQLQNVVLDAAPEPGRQWFTWSFDPGAPRPLRDNFSDDQPFAPPNRAELGLSKIHVDLWATVSHDGDVYAQTAEHLRRMAQLLLSSAAAVERESPVRNQRA